MSDCKRYAAAIDANQTEIVRALEKYGCSVYVIKKPVDLLVGRNGVNILMEVKTEKGKMTPEQKEFFDTWRGQKDVVHSVEEALHLVDSCCTWKMK